MNPNPRPIPSRCRGLLPVLLLFPGLLAATDWVVPDVGPHDRCFEGYPEQSIEEWHRTRGLWID